jgi:hypothetical protein
MSVVRVLHLPELIGMSRSGVKGQFIVFHGTILETHCGSGRWVHGSHLSWIMPVAEATIFLSFSSVLLRMVLVCAYWIAITLWLASIE